MDTNILLQAVASPNPYHYLITALRNRQYHLIISNSIMFEYEEIIKLRSSLGTWEGLSRVLDILRRSGHVVYVAPDYNYQLIIDDPDDNKFVDAALCGAAEYVVTEDKHFQILNRITVIQLKPMSPLNFITMLQSEAR